MILAAKTQLSGSESMGCFPAWLMMLVLVAGCSSTAPHFAPSRQGLGVDIIVHLPEAQDVRFASSRDGFQWHEARQNRRGEWQVTVPGRGEFRYFYQVDDSLYLPECPTREFDDFGNETCIYQQ
jgi:hypothetical protein